MQSGWMAFRAVAHRQPQWMRTSAASLLELFSSSRSSPSGMRVMSNGCSMAVGSHDMPQTRRVNESFVSVRFPFNSDGSLRDDFENSTGGARLGKVLETVDALAGSVAFKHCGLTWNESDRKLDIVTASVDSMRLLSPVNVELDMHMQACVIYTGTSSMSVHVEVLQEEEDGGMRPSIVGRFTMVAFHRGTDGLRRRVQVPRVVPHTEQEISWHEHEARKRAEVKQRRRQQKEGQQSTDTERALDVGAEVLSIQTLKREYDERGVNVSAIKGTEHHSLRWMHPQRRNMSKKIFGGYLIRESYEIALMTSILFQNVPETQIRLRNISDINFIKPVNIGDLVSFRSSVVYAHRDKLVARVAVDVCNKSGDDSTTTNTFLYSFDISDVAARPVLPDAIGEIDLWLEGRNAARDDAHMREVYAFPQDQKRPQSIMALKHSPIPPMAPFPVSLITPDPN